MAVGDVTYAANLKRTVTLMEGQSTVTTAPSSSTDGVPMYPTSPLNESDDGACFRGECPYAHTLMIHGDGDSGLASSGTFSLWGYLTASAKWYEIPVNGGTAVTPVAMAETDTDFVTHREVVEYLGHFDRVALQLSAVTTGAKAELDLDTVTGGLDTIIEATSAGPDGNDLTIAVVPGGSGAGTLTRVGNAFTFTYESGVTTVANFEAAVTALAGADDLIAVKTGGTGATVLSTPGDDLAATNLAGGTGIVFQAHLTTAKVA